MKTNSVPQPTVMPVDRTTWGKQLNLSNFVNAAAQYQDLVRLGNVESILVIGPGQGLDTAVFRWRGYKVTTFDIDETFSPDYLGSVHDLKMFSNQQFDVVIASHVLEHLAVPFLDSCLKEISRVGRHALIYLPVAGRRCHIRFAPGNFSWQIDLFNYFEKPDGVTPKYSAGQHFWEIGYRGYRVGDLRRRLQPYFEIVMVYRNPDWPCSMNFVVTSRAAA